MHNLTDCFLLNPAQLDGFYSNGNGHKESNGHDLTELEKAFNTVNYTISIKKLTEHLCYQQVYFLFIR